MVSVRIDFYRYRDDLKKAILRRSSRLDSEWDPFVASWLAYALSQDGVETSPPLLDLVERLERWANQQETRSTQRSIGPLCFLGYFQTIMGKNAGELINTVLRQMGELVDKEHHKFSPLNDPEQVFSMALLVANLREIPQNLKDSMKAVAQAKLQGPLKRRTLYCAALRELGETTHPFAPPQNVSDPSDLIALIWYSERYDVGECVKLWEAFANLKDSLSFEQDQENEGIRVLSAPEMALLYEALARETANPDPNLLFELYPLHPCVKAMARKYFQEGNYVHAVLESAKVFEEHLKEITGIDKNCRPLVQESFRVETPKIRFNTLQSRSEKDEQEGLKLIAEGICAAFRNPKAHEPADAPLVQISALEALDQLIIISYIFKRVERAQEKSQS